MKGVKCDCLERLSAKEVRFEFGVGGKKADDLALALLHAGWEVSLRDCYGNLGGGQVLTVKTGMGISVPLEEK